MSTSGLTLRTRDDPIVDPSVCHGPLGYNPSESIIVYLVGAGTVIRMNVLESDSIASLKLKIQTWKGFVSRKQRLVYGGRELARSDSLIRDYGVTDGNFLHLVLRLSDIQAITVKTPCGKELDFQVERSRNVGFIKQQIANKWKGFIDVKDQELVCDGKKLDDQLLIDDMCKDNDAVIHLLVRKSAKVRPKRVGNFFELSIDSSDTKKKRGGGEPEVVVDGELWKENEGDLGGLVRKPPDRDFILQPICNPKISIPSIIKEMVSSTSTGLERGNKPIRSIEGSGGAYFMQDSSGEKFVSVFKPMDEEPMAANNPQGLPSSLDGEGLKKGTRVGEGALREVAAYILDHPIGGPRSFSSNEMGFAGVPPTVMVKCLHEGFNHSEAYKYASKNIKIGSLQMFMKNAGSCEDMGPRDFPVDEVHKISVMDIRLANADRHAGNILISKQGEDGRIRLIPIDHGYCLPEKFEDCTFDWLYWPQAHQPYKAETIKYIKSLNAEKDIELLKYHGWNIPAKAARTLRISTMLLKKGAERGLTPFTIGSIMCRKTLKKESLIEEIVREAEDNVLPHTTEAVFLESVSNIMDHHLDKFPV